MNANKLLPFILVALLLLQSSCVERTITIRTNPPGGLVYVNDIEQGRSPVTFPFTWYGDYRVLIESDEYETLETHRRVNAPIYQWPVLDFVFEALLPFEFHDHHDWQFTLNPRPTVTPEELIDRAKDFRSEAQIPAAR